MKIYCLKTFHYMNKYMISSLIKITYHIMKLKLSNSNSSLGLTCFDLAYDFSECRNRCTG